MIPQSYTLNSCKTLNKKRQSASKYYELATAKKHIVKRDEVNQAVNTTNDPGAF